MNIKDYLSQLEDMAGINVCYMISEMIKHKFPGIRPAGKFTCIGFCLDEGIKKFLELHDKIGELGQRQKVIAAQNFINSCKESLDAS